MATVPVPTRISTIRLASVASPYSNGFAARGFDGIGAWILGRNMFGPVRGPWPDDTWKGWWGDNPPYHTPVFVLTHHPRASIAKSPPWL